MVHIQYNQEQVDAATFAIEQTLYNFPSGGTDEERQPLEDAFKIIRPHATKYKKKRVTK